MRLSVVIVNYNTRELLRACLHALQAQTIASELEIIVVDNASSDGSAAMVASDFPGVRLLAQARNTWFCGGNNLGSAAAQCDWVLLLNPDTEAAPDALEHLLRFAEAHPEYAGVTGRLIYPDGITQQIGSQRPTLADLFLEHTPLGWILPGWRRRRRSTRWYADWARDRDHDVEVAPGSCLLLRRSAARLDDALYLYFPEDDLAQRLKRPFRFVAAARITHHEKAATRSWLATQIYFRDLIVYARRHHGAAWAALLWLATRPLYLAMRLRRTLDAAR